MAERAAVDEVHAPLLSGYAIAESPPHSQREQSAAAFLLCAPNKGGLQALQAPRPAAKPVRKMRSLAGEGFGAAASVGMRGGALPAVGPVAVPGIELISWLGAPRWSELQHPFVVPISSPPP